MSKRGKSNSKNASGSKRSKDKSNPKTSSPAAASQPIEKAKKAAPASVSMPQPALQPAIVQAAASVSPALTPSPLSASTETRNPSPFFEPPGAPARESDRGSSTSHVSPAPYVASATYARPGSESSS